MCSNPSNEEGLQMSWVGKRQVVFCPKDSSTVTNQDILASDRCKHGKYVFVEKCPHGCLFIVESLGVQYCEM